ncbi:MAG: ATP-dependent Clp protease proteolytic subunit [Lachnospiraceae bacterium]|nr:ATP-dependent Clp protease proteolytic subunit [Lachnospiraceae bacterium]
MVINPIIYDESKGNDIFSKNLENRVIHLVGEIDDEMSASIIGQLLYLSEQGNEDIQLYINSPGGSVTAGMAIYDTMQYIKPDVATVCVGHAASMGAVILSGGKKGKRVMLPHAEVMIHQPSGGMKGQATELEIAAEHICKTRCMINELLAENCSRKVEEVKLDTERDHWMSAEETLGYGIVDAILKPGQTVRK